MDYSNILGMDLFGMPFGSTQVTRLAQEPNQQLSAPKKPAAEPKTAEPKKEIPAPQPAVTSAKSKEPSISEKAAGNTAIAQEQKPPEKETASSSASVPAAAQPDTATQPEKELVLDMSSDMPAAGSLSEASDQEKRKAHEAAEAKRKAAWEEKQRAKKQAEEAEIQRLQGMSDDDIIAASAEHIRTDIERITRRNMKECVAEHIQSLCRKDAVFARKIMHPRKSMIRCFRYINRQAKEYVRREMEDNDIKPDNGGYGCDVPDGLCYQWAVDYFNDTDAPEDRQKEETFVPKPYVGTTAKKAASKAKKAAKPAKKQESANNTYEQLTLGV